MINVFKTIRWSVWLGTLIYVSVRVVNNVLRGTPFEDTPIWMYIAEWCITILAAATVIVTLDYVANWHQKRSSRPYRELFVVTVICFIYFNFWMSVPIVLIAKGGYDSTNFLTVSVLGWLWSMVYYLLLRGRHFLDAYVAAKIEAEQLEREKLEEEIRSLRAQVNPHFLFNSLNTLSELVMENPQAEAFVDKLSSVYRYLLQSNDSTLCTLDREIKFIRAYFHLLETRHGRGVHLKINVGDQVLQCQLPPLTLQLLVENAVKHNIVSEETPLNVRIYSQDKKLVVENNIQKKSLAVPSNKVGLGNIAAKYRLLGTEPVEVFQDDSLFQVVLPMI